MKLTILTTITNPSLRQDRWIEALSCYQDLADEVVIVDGSEKKVLNTNLHFGNKFKVVHLPWPYNWNWIELPRHLNAGLSQATGDWILKLDIDQLIHENDFQGLRQTLADLPSDCQGATMQKKSFTYQGKYFEKGGQEILFRNDKNIRFGKNIDKRTDLCFPIVVMGSEQVYYYGSNDHEAPQDSYDLLYGKSLKSMKTRFSYWNYDYFFKTEDFTRREFWRMSQAYEKYFGSFDFGDSEEASFQKFLNMIKGRHDRSPYTADLSIHSKYIRKEVEELTPEQLGFNCWNKYANS
jgi:hypothetical protein